MTATQRSAQIAEVIQNLVNSKVPKNHPAFLALQKEYAASLAEDEVDDNATLVEAVNQRMSPKQRRIVESNREADIAELQASLGEEPSGVGMTPKQRSIVESNREADIAELQASLGGGEAPKKRSGNGVYRDADRITEAAMAKDKEVRTAREDKLYREADKTTEAAMEKDKARRAARDEEVKNAPKAIPVEEPKTASPIDDAEAEKLFAVTHGGPFDPKSKMDKGKMERIKALMADPSSKGLTPNQFALRIYRQS